MTVGDIYKFEEEETLWDKIKSILCILFVVAAIIGSMMIANAYQEHQLCLNGATEHCIEEDFK